MGVMTPWDKILAAAKEHEADIIGLSSEIMHNFTPCMPTGGGFGCDDTMGQDPGSCKGA